MSVYESKSNKKSQFFQFVLSFIFILLTMISLIPILHIIAISFSSKRPILSGSVTVFPVGFNTEAYTKVLSNSNFIGSFLFTILLTAGFTALSMCLTILAAYPLSKKGLKGKGIIMTLFVITMYFDPGIIPKYLNIKSLGLIDTVWSLLLPGALSAYNLIILKSFFMGIDNSLYEAAYIDGCTEFKALFKIAIPLAIPAIATLSLFYAVSRWNGVSDVLYYISDSNLFTVQLKLKQMIDAIIISQKEGTSVVNLVAENIKSASIVFSMVPMLIAYPFIQKYFTKGIMLGSVKG
ncbi:MAG: carbohydrate ABC transporter permease [Epulopiscium sp.]|nr:carbohydrate ABC transporter permease [Candidatus Epulonipiscium sp.]